MGKRYCESFNGKLRDECLNQEIFHSLKEARIVIEQGRDPYNTVRPHASLRYRPPAPQTSTGLMPTLDHQAAMQSSLATSSKTFVRSGIEPQIRTFPDGALIVAPMIAGDVDLGVVTSSAGLFNSISRGAAMKAVLCTGQAREGRAGTAIVVRTDHFDAGVKSLNDLKALKGKTVAVGAAGSINQYSMSRGLAASGLNPLTDVTWQTTVAQPDIVKQLGQKQIDAAELTYFLAFLAQRQGFGKIIASRDDTAPGSQVSMLAVRDDFLAKQRDVLVRYAMAHIHAARLFNKVAGAPEQNRDTVELITKNIFVKDITLLNAIAPHWEYVAEGAPNETSVMAQQDFWADTFKMVERKVAAPRIMDSSIAGEALKRLDAEKPFG